VSRGRPLCIKERELILRGIARDEPFRLIGLRLGRNPSVVSREVARNGGRGAYSALAAQDRADAARRRVRARKLETNRQLHDAVADGLAKEWSPQQITGRLTEDHPDDEAMRVSHETIYQALYLQARGELRTELKLALRQGRAVRRPRGSTRVKQARIAGMVNVSERPAEAEGRAVPGHWEGDLIIGKGGKSQVITLVERSTRFLMLLRLNYDRTAERTALVLSSELGRLPEELKRSLTWDQGVEMADHANFSVATDVPVFFRDPHSPWQRGSNENTNGLIRQYQPKGSDLSWHTQAELDEIAARLNGHPRQTLGWQTPAEKLDEFIATA
jgi:IS30 family transposase